MQPPQGQGQGPAGYGQQPAGYGQPPAGYGQQPTPGPAGPPNPAQTMGIVILVCALLLMIAMFTKGWASANEGRDTVGAGLFGFEGCRGDRCESADWDKGAKRLDIPSDVGTFRIFGMITGFLALAGMIAAGAMALSRNTAKIPLKAIQGVMGAAAGFLTYFAVRLSMSDHDVNFGPSYSAFLGIGGLIAAGVVMQHKLRPLVAQAQGAMPPMAGPQQGYGYPQQQAYPQAQQPQAYPQAQQHAYPQAQQPQAQQPQAHAAPPQPAPPQQAAQPCPRCGAPAQYVEQYQRYYCGACLQYI